MWSSNKHPVSADMDLLSGIGFYFHVLQNLRSARELHQFHHDVDELRGWMAQKEAVLDSEDQDLHSIPTLLRQHEALEVGGWLLFWRGNKKLPNGTFFHFYYLVLDPLRSPSH